MTRDGVRRRRVATLGRWMAAALGVAGLVAAPGGGAASLSTPAGAHGASPTTTPRCSHGAFRRWGVDPGTHARAWLCVRAPAPDCPSSARLTCGVDRRSGLVSLGCTPCRGGLHAQGAGCHQFCGDIGN
jgi:hypothetical protein